jgi:hypothetical protein
MEEAKNDEQSWPMMLTIGQIGKTDFRWCAGMR